MKTYETFTITEDHLKLVQRFYIDWDDSGYDGAPAVGLKRPYGNSAVAYDVAEIIGLEVSDDEDEPYTDDQLEQCLELHRQMHKVLQIACSTLKFEVGTYGRPEEYNTSHWVKI